MGGQRRADAREDRDGGSQLFQMNASDASVGKLGRICRGAMEAGCDGQRDGLEVWNLQDPWLFFDKCRAVRRPALDVDGKRQLVLGWLTAPVSWRPRPLAVWSP
ncbi:hypothetical protein VTJ04DRAFT_3901 [Mycothermus thermophilus]|uniref:uncharacterized protein n=1 Tax=Humicola insolens TaxID=85995 RepID=UPI0037445501